MQPFIPSRLRFCIAIFCAALALVASSALFGSDSASARPGDIDSILEHAGLKPGRIPGAALALLKNGQMIAERCYGVRDLRTLAPIDSHTNFRLASLTKQFTAMSIMLLVHDGKLRYEDRLTDIFPEFPGYGRAITIRNLLNHTSGLEDYEDLMPPSDPAAPVAQIQIHDDGVLKLIERQKGTKFIPGSRWAYSNSGYVILGLVVQKISGEAFSDFVRERIFRPLGMDGSVVYVRGTNDVPKRAFGHSWKDGWIETDQSPTSATLGDGGVYSSVADLEKWDRGLRRHSLLSQREMQAAITPVRVPEAGPTGPDGSPAAYGFGWFVNPYKGHPRMWHYGETMGFRTTIQRFTRDNLTVILLCNRADLDPSKLALQISDLLQERSKTGR